ncbi:tyrosine-type recombinase/integrase [Paenibacillus sp. WQ 127069]|uniref:Tyrosine-type recombinase/integrase n=1 Tax=Paenibacillus baimaensis TaxID=2982185 RepID=A0ABT2UQ81_9BACL|nr:tyrosine-type recombinase/integrase [Paenibacillus sp. WQ 127069]MCU6796818.1 tyrosine-type recombinase/integrase [Paenibacillus sp. WQ 127069]
MPIIENKSPLNHLRSDLQKVLANYSHEMVETVLNEMGVINGIPVPEKRDPSIQEAYEYYVASPRYLGLSTTSKKTYISELNQFNQFVFKQLSNNATLRNITKPAFLMEYLFETKNGNTRSKKSSFLRSFFEVTLGEFFGESIEELKRVLKIEWDRNVLPKALTKPQLSEVVQISAASRSGLRNFTIIMTFLSSGIRINELCNLQIGDVDKENSLLYVIPKGSEHVKKPRHINQLGLSILLNYINFTYGSHIKRLPKEEYNKLIVFSAQSGRTAIHSRTIEKFVKHIYEQCLTIPKDKKNQFSVHTFRHCFAVYGLDAGIDIFTLSKLLGHKDINSTSIYLRLFDDQLRKAIEKHPFAHSIGEQ